MKNLLKVTAVSLTLLLGFNLQAEKKEVTFKTNADIFKTIKADLVKADGRKAKVTKEILDKRFTLVYFSAHWCPPCRRFTPQLVKWYNEDHKDYNVILVSADRDNEAMKEYMKGTKMPWLGMKKGSDSEKLMNEKFKTGSGIPNLVLVEKGKIIASSFENGSYKGPANAYNEMKALLKKSKASKKK